jgi:hypothetical protein
VHSTLITLAHGGKLTPEAAVTFAWMMFALGVGLSATGLILLARRQSAAPWPGLLVGFPFVLLAMWFFVFAALVTQGVQSPNAMGIVLVGIPSSAWLLKRLLSSTAHDESRTTHLLP